MVILDQINVAMDFSIVPVAEIVELLKKQGSEHGRGPYRPIRPQQIIDIVDTVSEVKEIKRHYSSGIKERAGIEY